MDRKCFIDWGESKESVILITKGGSLTRSIVTDIEKIPPQSKVYLEESYPHYLLYQLLEKNCDIFLCDTRAVKKYREQHNIEKSDKNDAKILSILHQEQPSFFHKLEKPSEQEIMFNFLMAKYRFYKNIVQNLKQNMTSYKREFGKVPKFEETIKRFQKKKRGIIKKASRYIKEEYKKVKDIRGIGKRVLCRLLAVAHPKDFSSLSKFLIYCGYKGICKETGNYSRRAKGVARNMVICLLRHKNKKYYPLYKEIKADLRDEYPNYSKGRIDGMARNRIATLLLKEIYNRIHTDKGS